MNASVVVFAVVAAAAAAQVGTPEVRNPLTFTLDVAQLVLLGGLIWRLAKMSAAVEHLATVTGQLTAASKLFSDALADIVTRVAVIEDRENERRDRRRDDP